VTALQAVRDHGRLQPGQSVLVIGASGGVGSFAVQIARALGGHVTGVASTSKLEFIRSLGAEHVIDYTAGDITRDGRRPRRRPRHRREPPAEGRPCDASSIPGDARVRRR
jgi:NADPH:quinone reductase-like Zn-dependent oxidoreductase